MSEDPSEVKVRYRLAVMGSATSSASARMPQTERLMVTGFSDTRSASTSPSVPMKVMV